MRNTRPISWIKAARKDFQKFPKEAQEIVLDALTRACWINLKTLLDKAFRLFFPQKVPTFGGIGGKIQVLFPWKLGNWLPENR